MNRLPDVILNHIFSYLSVEDLFSCCRTSRRWWYILDSKHYLWKQHLINSTPGEFQRDQCLQVLDTAREKMVAFVCAWSEEDHSPNIFVNPNKLTFHRKPVAQSSDMIRGKRGFSSGQHYWTVIWHGPKFGSSAVVGVATESACVVQKGYFPLLGSNGASWGWNLSERVLIHDKRILAEYPANEDIKVEMKITIGVTLDMCDRTLAFDIDGKYLGIAFRDLPPLKLYPAVSCVYGGTEVSLIYHGSPIVG